MGFPLVFYPRLFYSPPVKNRIFYDNLQMGRGTLQSRLSRIFALLFSCVDCPGDLAMKVNRAGVPVRSETPAIISVASSSLLKTPADIFIFRIQIGPLRIDPFMRLLVNRGIGCIVHEIKPHMHDRVVRTIRLEAHKLEIARVDIDGRVLYRGLNCWIPAFIRLCESPVNSTSG